MSITRVGAVTKTRLYVVYKKLTLKTQVKSKYTEKIYHANIKQKEDEVAILILNDADFGTIKIIRDKEDHNHKNVNSPGKQKDVCVP